MLRPMILLARDIAVTDELTRLARLEAHSPCNATLGTEVGHRIADDNQLNLKFWGDISSTYSNYLCTGKRFT